MAITTNINIGSLSSVDTLTGSEFIPLSVTTDIVGGELFTSVKATLNNVVTHIGELFALGNLRESLDDVINSANILGSQTRYRFGIFNDYITSTYTYAGDAVTYFNNAYTYITNAYKNTFNDVTNKIANITLDGSYGTSSYILTPKTGSAALTIPQISDTTAANRNIAGLTTIGQLRNILTTYSTGDTVDSLKPAGPTTYGTISIKRVDELIKSVKPSTLVFNVSGKDITWSMGSGTPVPAEIPYATENYYGLIKLEDFCKIASELRGETIHKKVGERIIDTGGNVTTYEFGEITGATDDKGKGGLVKTSTVRELSNAFKHKVNLTFDGGTPSTYATIAYSFDNNSTSYKFNLLKAGHNIYGVTTSSFINTYAETVTNDIIENFAQNLDPSQPGFTNLSEVKTLAQKISHPITIVNEATVNNVATYAFTNNNLLKYKGVTAIWPKASNTTYGVVTENQWKGLIKNVNNCYADKYVTNITPIFTFRNNSYYINYKYQYNNMPNTDEDISGKYVEIPKCSNSTYGIISLDMIDEILKRILTNT